MMQDISRWMGEQYNLTFSKIPKESGNECRRIYSCAYRIYDEASGATGGPGGMLHMQEKIVGTRLKGIVIEYIYREKDYLVPDVIWYRMSNFGMRVRNVLAGAGYLATHKAVNSSIEFGDNPLLICHDLGCAYGAYLLGVNYVLIYHQQGSILNEMRSANEAISDDDEYVIKEIENLVMHNAVHVYFPSIGAKQIFMETSPNLWNETTERFSSIPLYNTIEEMTIEEMIPEFDISKLGIANRNDVEVFLSVSDYIEDKGLDRIPSFLKEYQKKSKKAIIWIVAGNVHNQKLFGKIKEDCALFGINNVLYEKRIPHNELLSLMNECDYYIMLHRKSIFDLAILEAMQFGKKIILSDCLTSREFNVQNNIVLLQNNEKQTVDEIISRNQEEWKEQNFLAFRSHFSNSVFNIRYAREIKKALLECGMYRNNVSIVNEDLAIWKNKFYGKKCMICGSGSSLESVSVQDPDIVYIALNKALFFDRIRFDFLFMQDEPQNQVYTLEDYNSYDCIKFYGIISNPYSKVNGLGDKFTHFSNVKNQIIRYELAPNIFDSRVDSFLMDFSNSYIQDAQSVLFSAVTLAVFMGFTEILLCGIDFSDLNYGNTMNQSKYAVQVQNNLCCLKREIKTKRTDIDLRFFATTNDYLRNEFSEIDNDKKVIVSAIYTKNYEPMIRLQRYSCQDDYEFDLVFISDEEWNQNRTSEQFAFFGGNTIKVRALIEKMEQYYGEILIFTDADLIFLQKTKGRILQELGDKDIVFLRERRIAEPLFEKAQSNINIGFVVMRCNERSLSFWKDVLSNIQKSKGWDQEIVNLLLMDEDYPLAWSLLSEEFLNGASITKEKISQQRICTSCGSIAKRLGYSKEQFLRNAMVLAKRNEWF